MRRISLSFLIITVCSFGMVASEFKNGIAERPDSISVSDSLDLFRDITDISKQIERRTVQTQGMGEHNELSIQYAGDDIFQLADTLSHPVDTLPQAVDSLLPQAVDTIPHSIIPPVKVPRDITSIAPVKPMPLVRNRLDSIYSRKENGTLQLPEYYSSVESMRGFTFRDTLFYNPLFLPMIFTGKILPRELSLYPLEEDRDKGLLLPSERTLAPQLDHLDFVREVRRDYYMKYPDRIRYSVASFDSIPVHGPDDQVVRETFNPFRELIRAETTYSLEAPGIEGVAIGRKYWVRSGEHSFQFIQNRFSDNWHRGGTNNLNFNSIQIFRANYKKDKVRFNNMLEWRLSVFNAPDDTVRSYRIGNDLIRYYGDFGIDAFAKGWSYSTNLEAKSQMLNGYPANSDDLRSAFLSPIYINAGVGLKYTLDKPSTKVRHRKFNLQLALDPISINYRYVWNDSVDVKRFGIEEGKKGLLDIGSNVRAKVKYNITRYITWDSELTYFTSYEKVIAGFENTLDLALSNAFSTKIYVHARFDDGVPPDPKLNYFQFTHTLTFGLSYKW